VEAVDKCLSVTPSIKILMVEYIYEIACESKICMELRYGD
jgi:hypothetical protein